MELSGRTKRGRFTVVVKEGMQGHPPTEEASMDKVRWRQITQNVAMSMVKRPKYRSLDMALLNNECDHSNV